MSQEAWQALADLRDQIAAEEEIGWWVVYNGDPDREYDNDGLDGIDEEDEAAEDVDQSTPCATSPNRRRADSDKEVAAAGRPELSQHRSSGSGGLKSPTAAGRMPPPIPPLPPGHVKSPSQGTPVLSRTTTQATQERRSSQATQGTQGTRSAGTQSSSTSTERGKSDSTGSGGSGAKERRKSGSGGTGRGLKKLFGKKS